MKGDGSSVEITMIGEGEAYPEKPERLIEITIPWSRIAGKKYRGLLGNRRKWDEEKGIVSEETFAKTKEWHCLVIDGIVFDFNPLGAGEYGMSYQTGVIRGVYKTYKSGDDFIMQSGSVLPDRGGITGSKLVIREGEMESDMHAHHALRTYHYENRLPITRLYSLGANKHGKQFTTADLSAFNAKKGFGWLGTPNLNVVASGHEGAFYSAVKGKDATFRISNLVPGIYFVQASSGNFTGETNSFSISMNGRTALGTTVIPPKELLNVAMALWVEGDHVDIEFKGDFLVSSIGLSFLMAKSEDFTYKRGYWVTDGYEPGVIYRNSEAQPNANFAPAIERIPMPVPGQEDAAPRKELVKETLLPDPNAPELQWTHRLQMRFLGNNSCTLAEYMDPAIRRRRLQEIKEQGANAIQVSGMLSRHTYPASLERSKEALRIITKDAHEMGLKVIDHHDGTLCWNANSGFVVVSQRLGETVRALPDMLPNAAFCITNPTFKKTWSSYIIDLMRVGVDGFQLDELYYYPYGCGCEHCRRSFSEETGWQLPLNELDPRLGNRSSALWKAYLEWRKNKVAQFYVDLRRLTKDLNPNVSFSSYTTHYGFSSTRGSLAKGVDLEEKARAVNIMGTEVMPRNALAAERSIIPFNKMFNILKSITGNPLFAYLYGSDRDAVYFGWGACNMTGQAGGAFSALEPPAPGQADFFKFAGSPDNMDFFSARQIAEIALYFSRPSKEWNTGLGMTQELFGTAQTLEELHIPYCIITDNLLTTENLRKYKFLVIGAAGCLSDNEIETIIGYAKQGGTVLMTGIAGNFNELGMKRDKWPFASIFKFTPALAKKVFVVKAASENNVAQALPLMNQPKYYKPNNKQAQPATLNIFGFSETGTPMPMAYEAKLGKGRMIFLTVPYATSLFHQEVGHNKPFPHDYDEVMAGLFRQYLGTLMSDARVWTVDAPTKVHTEIYRQGDSRVLHFLNGTGNRYKKGDMVSTKPPQPAFPRIAHDITFSLPAENVKEVYAVSPDFQGHQPLRFTISGNMMTVTLPARLLKAYTIVWIK